MDSMLFIVDEAPMPYVIGGATFFYVRLVRAEMARLQYLARLRGVFDEDMFNLVAVCVALRGWTNLYGQDGHLPWPLELPASKISEADQETIERLAALDTTMTPAYRAQLHGCFYVLSRLPWDIDTQEVLRDFSGKVRELEPEVLKKRWSSGLNGNSAGVIHTADMSLDVPIVDAKSEGTPSVIPEA